MTLTYARYYPIVFRKDFDCFPSKRILFFDPTKERLQLSIGDRLRRLDPSIRENLDLIVLRGRTPKFVQDVSEDPLLPFIAKNVPILLLAGCCGSTKPRLLRLPHLAAPRFRPALNQLRQIEIEAILDRTKALFAGPQYHSLWCIEWNVAVPVIRNGRLRCTSTQDMHRLMRISFSPPSWYAVGE